MVGRSAAMFILTMQIALYAVTKMRRKYSEMQAIDLAKQEIKSKYSDEVTLLPLLMIVLESLNDKLLC
jgi:hypothetical protein